MNSNLYCRPGTPSVVKPERSKAMTAPVVKNEDAPLSTIVHSVIGESVGPRLGNNTQEPFCPNCAHRHLIAKCAESSEARTHLRKPQSRFVSKKFRHSQDTVLTRDALMVDYER